MARKTKPSMRSGRGTVRRSSAGSYAKSSKAKPSMRSGRGTVSRSSAGSYAKSSKAKPSMRSGRGTVSRVAKRKPRAIGMRAGRASGKVRRSGRGYVTVSGGSAPKRAAPRPSMRSGRGTVKRSSAGSYKKASRKRTSTRSGRGYIRR